MMRVLLTSLGLLLTLIVSAPQALGFRCDVTTTALNFGGYDVFDNVVRDATGTITITCNAPEQNPNAPIPVTVSLSPGGSGTFAQRQMQGPSGSTPLIYNLFTNASCSSIWGDGSGSSSVVSDNVTRANPLTATIYGRIPPRQNVSAGQYSDLITVTIQW
jgi:spore coat protein U domain-containing protein, fimbrial subunit CupE1/2/3/6